MDTSPPQGSVADTISNNARWWNKAVETILEHYDDIFIENFEEVGAGGDVDREVHDHRAAHASTATLDSSNSLLPDSEARGQV